MNERQRSSTTTVHFKIYDVSFFVFNSNHKLKEVKEGTINTILNVESQKI